MKILKHLHNFDLDDFSEVLVKLDGEAIRTQGLIPFHLEDRFPYLILCKRCYKKGVLLI
jgi:hypothetical protein